MLLFGLYLIFTASYFLHLPARYPVLGTMRFDLVMAGLILLGLVLSYRRPLEPVESSPISRYFLYLCLFIGLSLPFVRWPGSVLHRGLETWFKVIPFFIFTILLVTTEKRLRIFLTFFLAFQMVRIIEPAYLHLTTGYWGDRAFSLVGGHLSMLNRLGGAPADIVNSNQLAWVVNSTLPFLYYLLWRRGVAKSLLFFALGSVCLYTLLLTGSRSGLISLFVIIITVLLMSKNKAKGVIVGLVILLPLGVVVAGQLSPSLQTRYLSMFYNNLPGHDTAVDRVTALKRQFDLLTERPLVGHGLGTSGETNFHEFGGRPQITHNLYIEVLQELGLIGFTIFILYLAAIFRTLRRLLRQFPEEERGGSWLSRVVMALQAWVVMDLIYSLSCFGLRSWEWYLFGGVTVVCARLAHQAVAVSEPALTMPSRIARSGI